MNEHVSPAGEGAEAVLRALRGELARDVRAALELREGEARRERVEALSRDLDAQLGRVEHAAVLTLVGSTGAGKSSLLNALVGSDVAHEGEQRPTTVAPVIYRPRDADLRDLLEGLPGEEPRVVDYDPRPGDVFGGQILIDAPDTNSVRDEHRRVVQALAERSDVLVLVAHRQSVAELASVRFVDDFARRRALLLVLNRADELSPAAAESLATQLRDLARERWDAADAPLVVTSARRARQDPSTPGWEDLRRELAELVRGGVLGRVRRHNALGTAARLGELFGTVRGACDDSLAALERETREGLEAWRADLVEETGRRLDLRRADLTTLLWAEVAKRWDGPGGWALRAGGLSTLGLGAGAALARRNPLVAAGAAVGAVAVDRARGAIRERSFADGGDLLPSEGELAARQRAALGAARVRADRLAADGARVLGLPDEGELEQEARLAVDGAWQDLVRRDLPERAERSAPAVLRWVVDLPVWALLAWVVVAAGRGLLDGQHVGLDFLLDVGIVAFAWLLLARTLVRKGLAGRARRLLAGARVDLESRLAERVLEAGERTAEAVDARRGALERLAGLDRRWRSRALGEG